VTFGFEALSYEGICLGHRVGDEMPVDLQLIGTTISPLHLNTLRIASLLWTAWVIWGMGRLAMVFSFRELRRSERFAIRIMGGISLLITAAVVLHAIGFAAGWTVPRITAVGTPPDVTRGLQPFAFGPLQLALLAAAGYAIDILQWRRDRRCRSISDAAGAARAPSRLDFRSLAPGIIVVAIVLFWFVIHYSWSMSYAWLEDNDPWDHAWAVDWIVKSGSFYEPLASHLDATTGQPDPIHVFHYLDAYPPGFDILLAVPAMVAKGSLAWVLKFYSVLLLSLGLLLAYPSCRALAEVGFASMRGLRDGGGSTPPNHGDAEAAAASRWIAAAGVFILSCAPAYPSRFIWSHLLLFVMWGGMMAPLIGLLRSWKLAIPLVWIVAASQLITTVTGAVLGLNLILLLVGIACCLPCAGRRIARRAGAWGMVIFIAAFAGLWIVTSKLNAVAIERSAMTPAAGARYQSLGAQDQNLRWVALALLALMLLSPVAATAVHTAREGWRSAGPAWRLMAIGLAGVALSMAWWGPMFARYAGAPQQRPRLTSKMPDQAPTSRADMVGLIETLAHPMDVQMGVYQQGLPWKWRGSQDRKYALWEFVVPPPYAPGSRTAINNSPISGIGLGAALATSVLFFVVGVLLHLFTPGRGDEPSGTSVGAARGVVVGLTLMLAHAFIGVSGDRASVPFQFFAFRYWHVLTFTAVFCAVVAISWMYLLWRRRPVAGSVVSALYVITAVLLTALSMNGYRGAEAVGASRVHTWALWTAILVLGGGAAGFLLTRGHRRRLSWYAFMAGGAAVGAFCCYAILHGAVTRLVLNNCRGLMTGVMDGGTGPESSMIEQLMSDRSRFGLQAGDRVFPLGGPYRFRFLVAADLDVPYYSVETYDWLKNTLLAPSPDPLRSSIGLRRLEWFYDLRPIEVAGVLTLVVNIPVLPVLPPASTADGSYSYQPDRQKVDFRMTVRRQPWLDLDGIRVGAAGIEVNQIDRPVAKDLPRYMHAWLRTNGYGYVWFDHAFYVLGSTIDCLDLGTGRVCSVNLFEVFLNDCLQSGLFAFAPGQEGRAGGLLGEASRFPHRPCCLLQVLPERTTQTYPYWLPCPDPNGVKPR